MRARGRVGLVLANRLERYWQFGGAAKHPLLTVLARCEV
jgi:hypothetical protein